MTPSARRTLYEAPVSSDSVRRLVIVWRAATIQYAAQPTQSIPIRTLPRTISGALLLSVSFAEKVKRRREANATLRLGNPTQRKGVDPTEPDDYSAPVLPVRSGNWGGCRRISQSERKHLFVNSLQDVGDIHKFTSVQVKRGSS
jgi:hypothetical protein